MIELASIDPNESAGITKQFSAGQADKNDTNRNDRACYRV